MNPLHTSQSAGEEARNPQVQQLLAPLAHDHGARWTPERSARVWSNIEEQRQSRSAWRLPAFALPLAAAAACALALFVWRGSDRPVAPEPTIAQAGDVLSGPSTLPSGAQLAISGQVQVARATTGDTTLVLESGEVTNTVPPVPEGGSYVVKTPAATVHVVGTVFTVRRMDDGGTAVEVTEGRVRVQPTDGSPAVMVSAGERHEVTPASVRLKESASATTPDSAPSNDAMEASVAAQNAALARGRTLSRNAPEQAVQHWGEFIARWPEGVHLEEAMMRYAFAQAAVGNRLAAAAAAQQCLDRFPESPYQARLKGLLSRP
ncbi:MAG: FecR domain-containing protein [Bradymonadia bacterium]